MGNEFLCGVTENTTTTARTIVSDVDDVEESSRELFEWVRDTYVWDMTKIRGAAYLLNEEPTYVMSFDKSNLLVALLRSLGIDARFHFITCTFHNEYKDRIDSSVHAPVEVFLDGDWVTADPAFGKHTSRFKSVSSFGEDTWESLKNEKYLDELPHWFVWGYNYAFRFVHPDIRRIRRELRACQDLKA